VKITSAIGKCIVVDLQPLSVIDNKLMKGIALRKHSLQEKKAASVLFKLFISRNE